MPNRPSVGADHRVTLGTSARIGRSWPSGKRDFDATVSAATLRTCGTTVPACGKPTHRQHQPKTAKPTRVVSVPSFTAEVLRERLVAVAEELQRIIDTDTSFSSAPSTVGSHPSSGALAGAQASLRWTTRSPCCWRTSRDVLQVGRLVKARLDATSVAALSGRVRQPRRRAPGWQHPRLFDLGCHPRRPDVDPDHD